MKNLWNIFTDKLGLTVLHPQYYMNKYNRFAIKQIKNFSKDKTIVDFGCGRMSYKKYLLETCKSYFGIDHPTESKNYISNEKPDLLTHFEKTKLKNNSYNTAMMLEVLEYLERPSTPEEVLKEIHRILKKNGKIFLTSPFMYPIHDRKIDRNRFTAQKINNLLKDAGFKKIKVAQQGNFYVFVTTSVLVYMFKKINNLNKMYQLFLIPAGLLLSLILNILTLFFENNNDADFPINILAIAEK